MATGHRLVRSAVRSAEISSDECYDFVCRPCAADDNILEAVKYCQECADYMCSKCLKEHNRFAAMRSHNLQDPANVTEPGPPPAKFVPTERCHIHPANPIDAYCGNHDVVCCGTCVSVNHRSCVDITCILDAAIDVTKSQDYKGMKRSISNVLYQLQHSKTIKQEDLSKLNQNNINCLTKIRDFRNTINHHLDDLEKAACDQVKNKHKENEDIVNSNITALEGMILTLEGSIDQLEKANTDNDPQIFVFTKIQQNQNDAEKLLQDIKASPKPEPLNFQLNTTIYDIIVSVKSLGEFVKSLRDVKPAEHSNQLYTVSLNGRYNVKVKGEMECDIGGCCLLPDGTLLITDWTNNKLKRLDKSYYVTDSCNLSAKCHPYGVCTTGHGEAAVALFSGKKIQFVSLGQIMTPTKSFWVGQLCWGVAYINGELFVSCSNPGQIHTYNTSGKRLRTFQTDAARQKMFSIPWHIAVSTDNTLIHVSDKENRLITLDLQGNKLSEFTDPYLQDAHCAFPESNGQMFICGFGSNNILQTSRRGQKLCVLLDKSHGVKNPKSLVYDRANSRLIVTMKSNIILVFDLSRKCFV